MANEAGVCVGMLSVVVEFELTRTRTSNGIENERPTVTNVIVDESLTMIGLNSSLRALEIKLDQSFFHISMSCADKRALSQKF